MDLCVCIITRGKRFETRWHVLRIKLYMGQLPFFVCVNNIIDEESQKDISRYIYSRDTKTPPYKGSYGETPHVWIQKYYIIKNAMMLRDSKYKEKAQDGNE